jgi:hypothetical protein
MNEPYLSRRAATQTWTSGEETWNVSIIEKNLLLKARDDTLITVAWIVIDSRSGEIRRRSYFQNIFFCEYLNLVQDQSRS